MAEDRTKMEIGLWVLGSNTETVMRARPDESAVDDYLRPIGKMLLLMGELRGS